MRTLFSTLLLILVSIGSQAQSNWGSPVSLRLTASSSFFLCDLGGKDAVGSNDLSDLNLEQTRYAFGAGMQYHAGAFSLGASAFYARLSADDRLTNASRSVRRLHAITDVVEVAANVEYRIGGNSILRNFYFNVGGGLMIYTPMARYNGQLVKLRPLGTEGQNYMAGRQQYSKFAPVIPFGFGYSFPLSNGSRLGIDLSMRKSFTDYLDDVSTVYADAAQIAEISGPVAAYLSDPSLEGRAIGSQRGDSKDNDGYFLIGFRYEIPLSMSKTFRMNSSCAFQNRNYGQSFKPQRRQKYRRWRLFR